MEIANSSLHNCQVFQECNKNNLQASCKCELKRQTGNEPQADPGASKHPHVVTKSFLRGDEMLCNL